MNFDFSDILNFYVFFSGRHSADDPFQIAQQQLMELLECDDFKTFNAQPSTVQTTPARTSSTSSTNRPHHVPNESLELEQHIVALKDSLESLTDDFELMESLIDENYRESIDRKRTIDDDAPDIDPYLINENDNLSLPENFIIDDDSPVSSIANHFVVDKVDSYVDNTQPKSNAERRAFSGHALKKTHAFKNTPTKSAKKTTTAPPSAKSIQVLSRQNSRDVNERRNVMKQKLTNKSVCSYSTEKILRVERKDSLVSTKKTVRADLSTSIKNSRNTGGTKVATQEQSKGDWFDINNEVRFV